MPALCGLGFGGKGGFVGEHDRRTRIPLPDHISGRPEDLASLIDGMVVFDRGPSQKLDAIFAAAILAFGFIYVHFFEDGNGRIHRYPHPSCSYPPRDKSAGRGVPGIGCYSGANQRIPSYSEELFTAAFAGDKVETY